VRQRRCKSIPTLSRPRSVATALSLRRVEAANPQAPIGRTSSIVRPLADLFAPGYATPAMIPFLVAVLAALGTAEESLIPRMAAGDAGALRQLYDHCSPTMLAVALRILRTRGEAEDVVQDAFVEAWRRAATFDPRRGTALSFVLAIARSRALDRLRSRGAEGRATAAFAREETGAVPLPIESAEQRQDRDRIQAALASLPPDQRTVLDLGYFEGLSQTEIAARTGDPLGTVKTRCRLALEKLAGLLSEGAS
jgi:RNA polymerase sigma-70 factor, ECF subfamily